MGEIELLDLYWTSAGPADVHVGREWSTFDWRERCVQAARVGFAGIGLWHADIEHQLQTSSLADMKRIFDDAGLTYLQVEFLADFFAEPGSAERAESDRRRELLLQTAAAFGAHHIKVGNIPALPARWSA
jgi:sugar phosphate isomerase/epimerase